MFFKLLFLLCIYKASSFKDDYNYEKEFFDLDNAQNLFDKFIKKFEKHYDSENEYYHRLEIFKKNLEDVNNRNRNATTEVYGITQFLDQTEEEFNRYYNSLNLTPDLEDLYEDPDVDDLQPLIRHRGHYHHVPDSWDWRKRGVVTPVRNQGKCGSCWAFSAVACVESQYAIKHRTLKALSEQQLLDCVKGPGCRAGGFPHVALNDAARRGGLMNRRQYYYLGRQEHCRFNKRMISVRVKGAHILRITDENRLKKLVHEYGPVSVALVATPAFAQYKGGIGTPMGLGCNGLIKTVNHAVVIVGYGKKHGIPYWIIKNSFGQHWGEHGFMKLIRGQNACLILDYVSTVDVP